MRKQASLAAILLGAATTLSACSSEPEEYKAPVEVVPTTAQIKMAHEIKIDYARLINKGREEAYEDKKKESIDGQGRIFIGEGEDTATIYSVGAEVSYMPIPGDNINEAKFDVESFVNSGAWERTPVKDAKTFAQSFKNNLLDKGIGRTSEDSIEVGSNGYKAVFNNQTNRVCVVPTATEEQDCFPVSTLDPSSRLAHDIRIVKVHFDMK